MSLEKFSNKLGVYILKDKTDKPIYIGKALNIKGRLKSHFRSTNVKEKSLVSRTSKINTILVESEIEALILEANLIQKFNFVPFHLPQVFVRPCENYERYSPLDFVG